MKEGFEKPIMTIVNHIGPLTNDEIAALLDDALAEYLEKNGYDEARRAAMAAEDRTAM